MAEFMRLVQSTDGGGVNILVGNYGAFFPKSSANEARFIVEKANEEFNRVREVGSDASSQPADASAPQAVRAGLPKHPDIGFRPVRDGDPW